MERRRIRWLRFGRRAHDLADATLVSELPQTCVRGHHWHAHDDAAAPYDLTSSSIVERDDCPVCTGRAHDHECPVCEARWAHVGRCDQDVAAPCAWCEPPPCPRCGDAWAHASSCLYMGRAVVRGCAGCRGARPERVAPARRWTPAAVCVLAGVLVAGGILMRFYPSGGQDDESRARVTASLPSAPEETAGNDGGRSGSGPVEPPRQQTATPSDERRPTVSASPSAAARRAPPGEADGTPTSEPDAPIGPMPAPAPPVDATPAPAPPSPTAADGPSSTVALAPLPAPLPAPVKVSPPARAAASEAPDSVPPGMTVPSPLAPAAPAPSTPAEPATPERSPLPAETASRPFWFAGRREPHLAPGGFAGMGGARVPRDRPDPRWVAAARGTVVRVIVTPPHADGTRVGLGANVDPAGHVLTSDQVVRGATAILVELPSGRRLPVVRIRRDPLLDLAVLAVDAPGLPSLPLGESNRLRAGEPVTAVGLAADATVANLTSTGSATGLNLTLDASLPVRALGGPLLDSGGRLVGIATGVTPGAAGIGQAIPIDRAKPMLREFLLEGSSGARATALVSQPETSPR